ncbi:helix-turn-helix transcriptional regulator [Eudoraea chungangensis]|uniref:helix-turn-helix transcriptional regulator n=1 Tax=Eudoraea chungangensis TaxID=1481905 RepID=UPI0023EE0A9A|nr:AraC family transcriptional regulator [Eudoraea chungangensis]
MLKNIAEGSKDEVVIEDDFYILKLQNETSVNQKVTRKIDRTFIQFHFCLKGQAKFIFNQGNYALDIAEETSLLLYNTNLDLPLNLELGSNSWLISVIMTLKRFHSLFSSEAGFIPFLAGEGRDQKYYAQEVVTPAIAVVLSQIINYNLNSSIKTLFVKAKVYELMALYFNKSEDADIEQCPFLVDEENIKRIKMAKEIMITRMAEPPTLKELSDEIGLSLKKLKEGFKQVYGEPVFSFLFDYKMDYARKMLESGRFNVSEVGHRIGYSTPSHFIASFKKKYGTTPKKYLISLGL